MAGTLSDAKARCRRAYHQARESDPRSAPLIERWYSETLLAVEGAPDAARDAMFTRTAILFEIMADRTGWPDRIRGLTARPAGKRKLAAA
jgi:hypothetical protein